MWYNGEFQWAVHKFGGTSMGNAAAMRDAASHIRRSLADSAEGSRAAVVVSAMAKATDALVEACRLAVQSPGSESKVVDTMVAQHEECIRELFGEDSPMTSKLRGVLSNDFDTVRRCLAAVGLAGSCPVVFSDLITGFGEIWSSQILAGYFGEGVPAINARKFLFLDESGNVDWKRSKAALQEAILPFQGQIFVITGFVCSTHTGEPCTLKRNGSDHSAAIVAALLHAAQLTIWKEVDGVLSADPRTVSDAKYLPRISYEEAAELSYFGAKVLHPLAMAPCVKYHIPIIVRNTFNPFHPGTLISFESDVAHTQICKGFTICPNLALLTVEGAGLLGSQGMAARLFGALTEAHVNVILITQASSEHSICVAVRDGPDVDRGVQSIERVFFREMNSDTDVPMSLRVTRMVSAVAAVGDGMIHRCGVIGLLGCAASDAGVSIVAIAQGSSERNITFIFASGDAEAAMVAMHRAVYSDGAVAPSVFSLDNAIADNTAKQIDAMPNGTLARDAVLVARDSSHPVVAQWRASGRTVVFTDGTHALGDCVDALIQKVTKK